MNPIPKKLPERERRRLLILQKKNPDECFCTEIYENVPYGDRGGEIVRANVQPKYGYPIVYNVKICPICGKKYTDSPLMGWGTNMDNRQIDVAIARDVFNWVEETVGPDYNGDFGGTPVLVKSSEWFEEVSEYLPTIGEVPLDYFVQRYSEGFNQAMSVLKEIARRGWKYSVVFSDDGYSVSIHRPEWVTSDLYQARAIPSWDTDSYYDLPRIMCLAALKAVEIDKKEVEYGRQK
jgi:hypothetical protein